MLEMLKISSAWQIMCPYERRELISNELVSTLCFSIYKL